MKSCLVIHGVPAVGKTTVSKKLIQIIGKKLPIVTIQGDFIAHMIYGCTYTESELDIKYENMTSLMRRFLKHGYSIMVDDFFRREKDVREITGVLSEYPDLHRAYFHLKASHQTLLDRNRQRDYWDWIPEKKMVNYLPIDKNISFPDELTIDTTEIYIDRTVAIIVANLEKEFYQPEMPDILSTDFTPIEQQLKNREKERSNEN